MSHLHLVTIIVDDYGPAIAFCVDVLGFELLENVLSFTNNGQPIRWMMVPPNGGEAGILQAHADGTQQEAVMGEQMAGRVGCFLRVDDFEAVS